MGLSNANALAALAISTPSLTVTMPFVEMPEGVSMFYRFRPASSSRTRSECADLEINSSSLDPAAPLLVSFSPWSVDGSYLIDRLAGPELAGWSLVVFDLRNHGQTCAPACPEFDFFVAGADIALAMVCLASSTRR